MGFILDVPADLERSNSGLRTTKEVDTSARFLLSELCTALEVVDLGATSLLDVGCGVKFTRAILGADLPVGGYFGIDVYAPVIEFLSSNVADPRFRFRHFDVHNERYNPGGTPLGEAGPFPVDGERFDAVLGYSLFTHLDPDDTRTTLARMRESVVDDGRAVFTAFLDEHSDTGFGWIDTYSEALGGSVEGIANGSYKDVFEDDPLRVTMYDRAFLTELLAENGWRLLEVRAPSPYAQHTVVAVAD